MFASESSVRAASAAFSGTAACAVRTVTVYNPYGVHIEPAAEVVALARRFRSAVHLVVHGKRVELRDILDVLAADLRQGTEVVVLAEGPDAEAAVAAVGRALASPAFPAAWEPWQSTVPASGNRDLKRVA